MSRDGMISLRSRFMMHSNVAPWPTGGDVRCELVFLVRRARHEVRVVREVGVLEFRHVTEGH